MVIFSVVSATQIICLGLTYIPLFNLCICFKVVLTSLYSLMASQLCSAVILITSQSVSTSESGTAVFCLSALENDGLWVRPMQEKEHILYVEAALKMVWQLS